MVKAHRFFQPQYLSIALEHYGRQAKDVDLETWATEIKLRAWRRLGEISRELPKSKNQYSAIPTVGGAKEKRWLTLFHRKSTRTRLRHFFSCIGIKVSNKGDSGCIPVCQIAEYRVVEDFFHLKVQGKPDIIYSYFGNTGLRPHAS